MAHFIQLSTIDTSYLMRDVIGRKVLWKCYASLERESLKHKTVCDLETRLNRINAYMNFLHCLYGLNSLLKLFSRILRHPFRE